MGFKFRKEDFKSDTYYDISEYKREKYEDAQYDLSKFVKDYDDIDDILNKIKIEIMIACDRITENGDIAITYSEVCRVIDKYYKDKMRWCVND